VLKGFIVPRGIAVLAGGIGIDADATEVVLGATLASPTYTIGENAYLGRNASSVSYDLTITVNGDGTWTYDQSTKLTMAEFPDQFFAHDKSTLHKAAES
jgi:hypothetical protein